MWDDWRSACLSTTVGSRMVISVQYVGDANTEMIYILVISTNFVFIWCILINFQIFGATQLLLLIACFQQSITEEIREGHTLWTELSNMHPFVFSKPCHYDKIYKIVARCDVTILSYQIFIRGWIDWFEINCSKTAMDLQQQEQQQKVITGPHRIRPWTWKRQHNLESPQAIDGIKQAALDNNRVRRSKFNLEASWKRS